MGYYFETHIVDHCNLNCAGCAHFSSLVKNPRYKNINEYKIEINKLKELFGVEIDRIALLGGEPLLHPNIEEFIIFTKECLPNAQVEIVTNGLLMKSKGDDFINLLNNLDIKVRFSDYGLNIDKSFTSKLKLIEVTNITEMFNISLNLNGTQNSTLMYYLCPAVWKNWHGDIYGGCFLLKDGFLYNCAVSAYASDFERQFNFKFDESLDKMGINIFTHNKDEIIYHLTHPHEFCKYCNIYRLERSNSPRKSTENKVNEWIDINESGINQEFLNKQLLN